MRYRALGTSGLTVSEIGFGAWGIGGRTAGETSYGDTDDRRSRAALERALALGITFFDTANVYGDGHSERLIGEVFAGARAQVVIATKAGLEKFGTPAQFTPERLRRSLEGSLARLKSDYVDLLQLHDPPSDLFRTAPEVFAALEDFRREDMVRAFGVSAKSPADALKLIEGHALAAVQVNLNMLDVRAAEGGLLEIARARGIGIIARTPLSFGFLSGAPETHEFPPGDHRRSWPVAQLERWRAGARAAAAIAAEPGEKLSQAALRFCLSFAAVSSVIPGILGAEEADENAQASDLGPLSESVRERILALNRAQSFFAGG
ncbi:MAG TPA: aldo/keto reductase [Stellaceae bacterium]|nr:aldo/keto reductase [Stellaceae bacterium]